VHGEADGLPGLVVDRFADVVVVQALSLAADRALGDVVPVLETVVEPRAILHRSDDVMRTKEGLGGREPLLAGRMPDAPVRITECGLVFEVDVTAGHKTGFYLDQRDNRQSVAARCAGAHVLDGFCYTGGFSTAAAAAGACSIVQLDSSSDALVGARRHLEMNGFDRLPLEQIQGDAFAELRRMRDAARSFDVVILDPPKFAPTRSRLERALRGYKDVNLQALKLVRPGGLLASFSCSGAVDRETFQTVVFQAAVDAGREVRVLADLGQPEDHPVLLTFPESRYLKGLLCRVE
jgi:23S rRNA (cytosine1962-C5)-methyltransferase